MGGAPNDAAPLATIDDQGSRHTARAAGPPGNKGAQGMTLKKKGKFWYGTTQEDLQTEMRRYSVDNVYEATRYAASACACGGKTFTLDTDEDAGVALRTCTACGNEHYMGDSASYADEAEPARHPCVCDGETFELLSGVALYEDSNDVRWYYIGCRCAQCDLVGVFADWKCEAGDADAFLAAV
ncbi:hypothetical protein WJ968_03275 [Achromobacter xylosoxidans]